jgi:hypothetical protein
VERIVTMITSLHGSTRSFQMKMKGRALRQKPSKVYTRKIESQASFWLTSTSRSLSRNRACSLMKTSNLSSTTFNVWLIETGFTCLDVHQMIQESFNKQ